MPRNKNIHEDFFTILNEKYHLFKCKKYRISITISGIGYTNTVKHAKNHADWKMITKLHIQRTQSDLKHFMLRSPQ